ncbi:MAG: LamG domain-containing protein [Calothrix sp. SM1_5_4]|nr:LamG domain-containing protein [Calothrix sp. SM1_5_4]
MGPFYSEGYFGAALTPQIGTPSLVAFQYDNVSFNDHIRVIDSSGTFISPTGLPSSEATNIDLANPVRFWIGSSDTGLNFDGTIHEVLFYDRALNASEVSQVNCYLRNKWALAPCP